MDAQERAGDAEEDDAGKIEATVKDLLSRARNLLAELESLRNRLKHLRTEGFVEVAHYRSIISSEANMLERLSSQPYTKASAHIARSSNLPFLENVWANAKKSQDLVALQKRVFFNRDCTNATGVHYTSLAPGGRDRGKKTKAGKDECITMDAIANGGHLWLKVSLITNNRIIYDLAKQGWISDSDDDADSAASVGQGDDDYDIPVLKTAKELVKASSTVRVYCRQPIVHLVLPRVQLGVTPQIDEILRKCKKTGVVVRCGEDFTPVPPLEEALERMAPDPMKSFSDTLNIDCTILLALVSDFSHARVTKEPWFHRALRRQVEIEDNENLLPSLLYPALDGHALVCTEEAAKRMREIVETIGTPSEKARTALMMGVDGSKSTQELLAEMQSWSAYSVPDRWAIPIRVVSKDEDGCISKLSSQALAAGEEMTAINQSVFLHGWATGRTTITSNRIVVKQIDRKLEEYQELDKDAWPKIWLCPTARSLVGKEKRGAKKDEKKEGASPRPDPLRREHQRRNCLNVLSQREGHQVEDLRPNGYPSEEVIAAKLVAQTIGRPPEQSEDHGDLER